MNLNDKVKIKSPQSPGEAAAVFLVVETVQRNGKLEVGAVYVGDMQGRAGKVHRFSESEVEVTP